MNLKYCLSLLLIVGIVKAVSSSDCDKINAFYQANKIAKPNNENDCCSWSNIECNNNSIKSFKYVDDSNIKIDFSTFPVLNELISLTFQGKYLMGGSVPIVFFSQPKLKELMLDNSNIWELPNINSNSVNSLETISLKNNLLTSFPYNLKNINNLKNLNISNNKMSNKLNDGIKEFPSLEKLDISSNFLNGDLPVMPNNIKELIIDDNQFSSLSLSSSQSPNLEIFSANNNNLGDSSFSHLTGFTSLKKISLDNTDLNEIPSSIDSLNKLTYLSLRRNSITQLPESFGSLSLEELNISDNSNLDGKLKKNANIKKCYINNTKICLENDNSCEFSDSSNICGESGNSGISTFIIIVLIIIIIGLISYIIYFVVRNKKENNGFSRMTRSIKDISDSIYSNDSTRTALKNRTSKEVINTINETVNQINPEKDTKAKNAEIAFSNGLKVVGSPEEAFKLPKNNDTELKEIFKDFDSIDGEITQASSNNSFDNGNISNTINSLNCSVISNSGINSEHMVPIFNSLPRLNYMSGTNSNLSFNNYNTPHFNTLNSSFKTNNNTSNPTSPNSPTGSISPISPTNSNQINILNAYYRTHTHTQSTITNSNIINNNNNSNSNSVNHSKHQSIVINNTEIKKRPRSRSSLANASEIIMNNNINILRMNARDTTMPGIRQDYAKDYVNEYNNKINSINTDTSSQIYTNDLWNTVNGFNIENFNNFDTIQNNTNQSIIQQNGININNQNLGNNNRSTITNNSLLNNDKSTITIITHNPNNYNNNNNNNNNNTNSVLLTYPVYGSLKRNQLINQSNNVNNDNGGNVFLKKELVTLIPINNNNNSNSSNNGNNNGNNTFLLKKAQANIPTLIIKPSEPVKPSNSLSPNNNLSLNRNISLNSKGSSINTDTNTNIASLITQSNSFSLSSSFNSSFSEDELTKNIMFQNPSINKSNSNITGNSNNLLPIFNHKDSIKSSVNSISTGNVSSSLDLHLDSVELDEFLNDINSK